MNIICFDIEATDNGEILELSVFSYPGNNEIYHSYFKPVKAKEWKTTEQIHHITPLTVASAPRFSDESKKIQAVISSCDMITGFAIENDLRYLRNAGIHIDKKIPTVDVRDLFWVSRGKEYGLTFGSVPRLSKCAEMAGLDFDEQEDAHSATNDTLATLKLFELLINEYNGGKADVALCRRIERQMDIDREEMMRVNARGIISLQPVGDGGYKLKNNRLPDDNEVRRQDDGGYAVIVESRYLAEHDLRSMFARRADRFKPSVYRLRKADIERFLAYSNSYNEVQEMIYRNRYGCKRAKVHLDFNV